MSKAKSRRIATIAYAPVPEPGYGYVYGEAANRSPVTRSPYAEFLDCLLADGTLYAWPKLNPSFAIDTLPSQHQPEDTPPPLVPLPLPSFRKVSDILRAERTGVPFRLPVRSANNVKRYRREFPEFEFYVRKNKVYARYRTPDTEAERLPDLDYGLPADLRGGMVDRPEPGTVHVYCRPDAPRNLPWRLDLARSAKSRYLVYPLPIPEVDIPFLTYYGKRIICLAGEASLLPEFPDRYVPIKIEEIP